MPELVPCSPGLREEAPAAFDHFSAWVPSFAGWWRERGPCAFTDHEAWLRTTRAVDVHGISAWGWSRPDAHRWGLFLASERPERRIGHGRFAGLPPFEQPPEEMAGLLERLLVIQADTEPASVEQQRRLAACAPSLWDLRSLLQVNVEEARHAWATAYLLLRALPEEQGRHQVEQLLHRQSAAHERPRLLDAFNVPVASWLDLFGFTMFTDRIGRLQLSAFEESSWSPLARTARVMAHEEAHHLQVGELGIARIVGRTAELLRTGDDVEARGGLPLGLIQRRINRWFALALDLLGGEVSDHAALALDLGLKGGFDAGRTEPMVLELPGADGTLQRNEVAAPRAHNERMREAFERDCHRALAGWNRPLELHGLPERLTLPDRRFHRTRGAWAGLHTLPEGLPTAADDALLERLSATSTLEGCAGWLLPGEHRLGGLAPPQRWVRAPG